MSSKQPNCESCGWEVFGKDGKGYFCFNCGNAIANPDLSSVKVMDFTSSHEDADGIPATIPLPLKGEELMKKKVAPRKAVPQNRAKAKKPVKHKATPKGARKAAPRQDEPKEGTIEYYAKYGKRDGLSRIPDEKRGAVTTFINEMFIRNLKAQKSGRLANMKSDVELATMFTKKFPDRNFQSIPQYRAYFNGGKHKHGIDGKAPTTALKSKAAAIKAKAK